MTDLLIRNLDPELKRKLQARAREHGRSLSEEAKSVLDQALGSFAEKPIGTALRELFEIIGPVDLDIPRDELPRKPPDFE